MVDSNKIASAISGYKQYFPKHWKDEKYKWEAIKHFQDNWDIDAPGFGKMFERATSKANNLLTSRNVYPAGMILEFANADESATREMFRMLFDESLDLAERITAFRERSEELRRQYGNGEWKNHYQSINYISTYLWLMYPDKYYIYKYELFKKCAEYLDDSYRPKANGAAENMIGGYRMYDEIRAALLTNSEIKQMLETVLTESCYSDPELITVTIDFGFYIARFYLDELAQTDKWLPPLEEYNPGLSADDWMRYLQSHKCLDNYKMFLAMLYDYGGTASCKQLEKRYQKDAPALAGIATNFAKQAWQYFQCEIQTENDGSKHYWSVPFFGRKATANEEGEYLYCFRPELKTALDQFDILRYLPKGTEVQQQVYPLNTILYGPPGTGKTYHTAIYAVAIIDEKPPDEIIQMPYSAVMDRYHELREKGQIAFTTFHQSYGYEDFIEGIRPVFAEEMEDETGSDMQYEVKPGVFQAFCRKASVPILQNAVNIGLNDNPTIWKVSLEGTGNNPTRTECMQNNHIRIGWDEYGPAIRFDDIQSGKTVLNAFMNRMRIGDIVLSCYSASTIDAIGVITGEAIWDGSYEYYNRVRNVKWLVKGLDYDITSINGGKTMTLSTVYALNNIMVDDVMKVLRETAPSTIAVEEERPNYVFIIDEINRGNISKIFGELITLIEPTKRAGQPESVSAILPYSQKAFSIPDNVYLLGTMNTADRSIALLDTALRRRFSFIEMMPEPDALSGVIVDGLDIAEMLRNLNQKIEVLYDREHTIGHAFFIPLKDEPTITALKEIFLEKVLPLLQEYFYDDYEKIRLVLGDNKKTDSATTFISKVQFNTADLFGETELDTDNCVRYEINRSAFVQIESYKSI